MSLRLVATVVAVTLAAASSLVSAAEVRNLHVGQEGKRAFVQYDLAGKPGEKLADVTVSLVIGGDRYPFDRLSLSGDYGKNVKIGIGKRIYWDLLKDMPAGYEGEIGWDVEAASTAEFAVVAPTPNASPAAGTPPAGVLKADKVFVLDESSGLMWAKLGVAAEEKMTYDQAMSSIARMNKKKFGGFDDWRMPTEKELDKLYSTAKKRAESTKENVFDLLKREFDRLANWKYWVLTLGLSGPTKHYAVDYDLENGMTGFSRFDQDLCVLPVRNREVNS